MLNVLSRCVLLAAVVALTAGGCVIPPPGNIVFPGQLYQGECDCCTDQDPSGTCLGDADDFPVRQCSIEPPLEDANRQEIHDGLTDQCDDQETILQGLGFLNAACMLDIVNPQATGLEQYFIAVELAGMMCPDREEPIPPPFPTAGFGAQTATFNSVVIVSDPDFSAIIDVTGTVEFSGGNCALGSCPITLHSLRLASDEFEVTAGGDTTTVTDAIITNLTEATGTCTSLAPSFPNTCVFLFEPNTLRAIAIGTDQDGDHRMLTLTNTLEGGGAINFATREITVTQTFTDGDTVVEFGLHGTVANFSPRVVLPGPLSVACGFGVEITAEVEDVDGDADQVDMSWYVDGELVTGDTTTLVVDLAPGVHQVTAAARDSQGGFGAAGTTVEVSADTTPPEIVGDPAGLCLWSPNHDLLVITSDDVGAIAVDDCDPNPTVFFSSGNSSQPDNAQGDGNTTGDIVVHPESVCVRAERQGTDPDGRTYTVNVMAVDSSGNSSGQVAAAVIDVPHDQSPDERCDVSAGTPVEDDDPRCVPPAPPPPSGCSAGGLANGSWLLVVAFFGLAWRRRRLPRS